jgi:hypothetical protein
MIMTVLPASHIVDLRRVKEITGASTVALAEEEEYAGIMDECEPGGEPPFGEFFGMKVYMSTVLSESSVLFLMPVITVNLSACQLRIICGLLAGDFFFQYKRADR